MENQESLKMDSVNLFNAGLALSFSDEKDKSSIGFNILEKIKNENPDHFLENCKLGILVKRLSFHTTDLQVLKQLLIWKKSLTNEIDDDLKSINQFLNDLFSKNDLPYELIIEGFSMIIMCNCSPNIKLVIATLISLLQSFNNDNSIIKKEHYSIINTIIKLVNIMSSSQFYNLVISKVIQIISTNHTSSSYLSLILPEYKRERLNGIKLSIEEIMKCLFTLLSWPQSNVVSNWIDELLSHFYFELMNTENKKQYCDLMIDIIEYFTPIICAHILHGIEAHGCLKTLENLMYMISSSRIFQKILPTLITTLVLYQNTKSIQKKKISFLVEDVISFEEISKSKSPTNRLYNPEKCQNLKTFPKEIAHLIYSLIFHYSNNSNLYSNVLSTLSQLFPLDNCDIIEERVKRFRSKHDLFKESIKNHKRNIEIPRIMSPKSDFMRQNNVCGLINLGNTCYLNSYLQILYMTKPFRNYIYHSQGPLIIENLRRLFARMSIGEQSAISPLDILNHLPDYFKNGSQQDASEFGKILFDLIDESYKKISKESPTSTYFEGNISTTITCSQCNERSLKNESFIDLSLSFPSKKNLNVTDLLEYYLSPEILEGENQYFCEKCNALCNAKRVSEIRKSPKYLLLTLSRFHFDVKSLKRHKILDHVSYPEILNLKVVEEGNLIIEKYVLYGIIIHSGRSAEYGHYYAFSRNVSPINNKEDIWIKFNDEYVTPAKHNYLSNSSDSASTEVVYILAYMKMNETELDDNFFIPDDLKQEIAEENQNYLIKHQNLNNNP